MTSGFDLKFKMNSNAFKIDLKTYRFHKKKLFPPLSRFWPGSPASWPTSSLFRRSPAGLLPPLFPAARFLSSLSPSWAGPAATPPRPFLLSLPLTARPRAPCHCHLGPACQRRFLPLACVRAGHDSVQESVSALFTHRTVRPTAVSLLNTEPALLCSHLIFNQAAAPPCALAPLSGSCREGARRRCARLAVPLPP